MFTTTLITVNDIHLNVLQDMYNANNTTIDKNSSLEFDAIKNMFTHEADNKLTAQINRDSDGTIAGYTTGVVRKGAYHCTNVVVNDNKAFILSAYSFHKALSGVGIKYIKGHVQVGTPMYEFMTKNLGRDDLFSSKIEGPEGAIITLTLL
mgnify:FL=1